MKRTIECLDQETLRRNRSMECGFVVVTKWRKGLKKIALKMGLADIILSEPKGRKHANFS